LLGNWRDEHLFALKQALGAFDFCASQLAECDAEVERAMSCCTPTREAPRPGKRRSRAAMRPSSTCDEHLFKISGVDLTRIDGIDVTTAMTVISEIGTDMSRFQTVKHFTSWLGLCPGTRISGGKVLELGQQAQRATARPRP
jgi:transposase